MKICQIVNVLGYIKIKVPVHRPIDKVDNSHCDKWPIY